MNAFISGNTAVPYKLEQERRKTFAVHAYPGGKLIVKAPMEATAKEVENFIKRKAPWILQQLCYFNQFKNARKVELSSGTEMFYLGSQYKIIIKKSQVREYVELEKSNIILYSPFPNNNKRVKNIFKTWITEKTNKELALALRRCLKKFPDMITPNLRIRKLSKRWGSYVKPNSVILNPDLIFTPKKCVDYVVLHELCHYYHKDHSAAFYSLLGSKMPNWPNIKEDLEKSIRFNF